MRIHQAEFEHPTQATRVRLNVYEYRPADAPPVAGLGPPQPGYLVTEDRVGTVTVVATLGFFADRGEALTATEARARELEGQRYRRRPSAA